jgi:hypothetical protein
MKNNYDLLWKLEKNCHGVGITWQMIFEITDTYLQTGMHDETLYPTFVVKKHSDDILEVYNKECKQYTMVTLFDNYNWQSFHISADDRDKLGIKKFNEFVEWFGKVSTTGWTEQKDLSSEAKLNLKMVEGVKTMFERYRAWSHKNYEWLITRNTNTRMVCGVAALCVLMVGSYLLRTLFTTQQMDLFGRNMAKAPPIFFVIFCTTVAVGCTLLMIAVFPTIKRMAKYTRSFIKRQ